MSSIWSNLGNLFKTPEQNQFDISPRESRLYDSDEERPADTTPTNNINILGTSLNAPYFSSEGSVPVLESRSSQYRSHASSHPSFFTPDHASPHFQQQLQITQTENQHILPLGQYTVWEKRLIVIFIALNVVGWIISIVFHFLAQNAVADTTITLSDVNFRPNDPCFVQLSASVTPSNKLSRTRWEEVSMYVDGVQINVPSQILEKEDAPWNITSIEFCSKKSTRSIVPPVQVQFCSNVHVFWHLGEMVLSILGSFSHCQDIPLSMEPLTDLP